MPGISGLEVLETLHEIDPTVVAIVITGYATVSSAVDAMKRGAYDFLPKPFTPEELRLIVRRGLEKRSLVLETMALRREREVLRENFAAIIAHELRSPLGAVQQNLFVMIREFSGKQTDKQDNRMERMRSRIDDLLRMIDTWLRGFSVDADAIKDILEPVEVRLPVERAIETLEQSAVRKALDISARIECGDARVLGDRGTLTEALINILGNAVKYSPDGGRIVVTVTRDDGRVAICIADQGPGIPEEDLPRIFDDFYRSRSTASGQSGAGIGLAISRRIVDAHGGSIVVESEMGSGSTFVITLPALDPESVEATTSPGDVSESISKGDAG